jgi:hypothetical protein
MSHRQQRPDPASAKFEDKLAAFNSAIRDAAKTNGLVFVNGPDPAPLQPDYAVKPSTGFTNGQHRGVYLLAVAEVGRV